MLPPTGSSGLPNYSGFFSALRSGLRNNGLQAFNGIAFEKDVISAFGVLKKNEKLPMT
jgi:hypothetical protein